MYLVVRFVGVGCVIAAFFVKGIALAAVLIGFALSFTLAFWIRHATR